MTKELQKHLQVDSDTGEVLPPGADFSALAEDLAVGARGQGIELTGPNCPLTAGSSVRAQWACGRHPDMQHESTSDLVGDCDT